MAVKMDGEDVKRQIGIVWDKIKKERSDKEKENKIRELVDYLCSDAVFGALRGEPEIVQNLIKQRMLPLAEDVQAVGTVHTLYRLVDILREKYGIAT